MNRISIVDFLFYIEIYNIHLSFLSKEYFSFYITNFKSCLIIIQIVLLLFFHFKVVFLQFLTILCQHSLIDLFICIILNTFIWLNHNRMKGLYQLFQVGGHIIFRSKKMRICNIEIERILICI